jgi:hypothetical protein
MKEGFALFVSVIATLSTLRGANADALQDCFFDAKKLIAEKVYFCETAAKANKLWCEMERVIDPHHVNVDDRRYGPVDAITFSKKEVGRVDCYRQSYLDPRTNEARKQFSCLLYYKGSGSEGDAPFPWHNMPTRADKLDPTCDE